MKRFFLLISIFNNLFEVFGKFVELDKNSLAISVLLLAFASNVKKNGAVIVEREREKKTSFFFILFQEEQFHRAHPNDFSSMIFINKNEWMNSI